MHHHGASVGRVLGLHPPDEAQQPSGVVGNTMVRPSREVEQMDLPNLMSSPLWVHTHPKVSTHTYIRNIYTTQMNIHTQRDRKRNKKCS